MVNIMNIKHLIVTFIALILVVAGIAYNKHYIENRKNPSNDPVASVQPRLNRIPSSEIPEEQAYLFARQPNASSSKEYIGEFARKLSRRATVTNTISISGCNAEPSVAQVSFLENIVFKNVGKTDTTIKFSPTLVYSIPAGGQVAVKIADIAPKSLNIESTHTMRGYTCVGANAPVGMIYVP